jgi:hypothetical protein
VVFGQDLPGVTGELQQNAHHPVFELCLFAGRGNDQTLIGQDGKAFQPEPSGQGYVGVRFAVAGFLLDFSTGC